MAKRKGAFTFDMQGERLWKYRAALEIPVQRCTPAGRPHLWESRTVKLGSLAAGWKQTEYKKRHDAFVARVQQRKAA